MRRQRIQLILLLLLYLKSKVIVIDDVGATKQFGPDKKDLVDKVRKKINSGNEEVVIYGKNKRNRNIRISSNDIDPNAKLKKEKEIKDNRIRLNNQKIINSLKRLVNEQNKMPTRKPRRRRRFKNNNIKQNFPETINNNPQNIDDKEPKVEIDEPVVENLSFDFPEDHTHNNDTTPNPETSLVKSPLFDFDPINDLSSLFKPKNNYFDDFLSSYKPQTPKNDFLPNFTPKTEDSFKIHDKTPDFNKDTPAFDSLLPSNSINKDNISLLKDQENKNLLRAINNRKEYLRIKIEEVNNKKENIARQLSDYKKKIEDLFNRISTTRNLRDKLYTKMNMEKSHITNLNMNSKEIKEKEGKLKDMIRSSRDQIIQYKSFLENEMAKLDVLEKQYEVYENTLKRYNDDCIEENNNLLKVQNDLAKYEKDLKDLNEIFSNFKCKHYNLNDELNRQSKIESDLEMEKDKVNRNGLSGLF